MAAKSAPTVSDGMIAGLRVRSAMPLPGLWCWSGEPTHPVDLQIETGAVPDLASPMLRNPLLQIDGHGACRFEVPGVAAYRVEPDGRTVTIDVRGGTPVEVRTFLAGTVLAIVFIRHGLLPLHACCVQVGAYAVAFAGESGAGKSTLAAGLAARGFPLLADDVTVVDLTGAGPPMARPGAPGVKLWRDALDRMGRSSDGLEPVRPTLEKYHVPVARSCARALPLAAVIHLTANANAPAGIRPLGKMAGLGLLPTLLYRQRMMLRMGLQDWQMQQGLRLVGAISGIGTMRRPQRAEEWDALVAALPLLVA